VLRFKGLLADTGEPVVATPAVGAADDTHAPLVAPAVEGDVRSPAVLTEVPLAGHGTLVGERRIVLHVLREGERIGLEATTLVLDVELPGGGAVVELEELELGVLTLTTRHRVHGRLGHVLLPAGGVERLLRGLVSVDARNVAGEHVAHHFDELTEWGEKHHSEVVSSENLLNRFGAELVAMLAQRVAKIRDHLVDLSVGHVLGWGHDLGHGVILLLIAVAFPELGTPQQKKPNA